MINKNDIRAILDSKTQVVSTDGENIGNVGQVYLDDVSGEPTWVTVKTGLFGTSESFVPVDSATYAGDEVRVPYTKDVVKDAPRVEADTNISPAEEDELYRYYGTQQGTERYTSEYDRQHTTAGVAGTHHDRDLDADRRDLHTDKDGVTLHEENVDIHAAPVAGGDQKVRLRKYTVTENVTKTVPVTREEVRLERTPATGADVERDAFTDKDGEVVAETTLRNEEVVVDRDVRATENVSLGKESHTEQAQVTEPVRREEVEVEREVRGDVRDRDIDGKRI